MIRSASVTDKQGRRALDIEVDDEKAEVRIRTRRIGAPPLSPVELCRALEALGIVHPATVDLGGTDGRD